MINRILLLFCALAAFSAAAQVDKPKVNLDGSNLDSAPKKAAFRAAAGLGNVDNTSDVNKPVSSAQAAAISAVASDATASANAAQAAAISAAASDATSKVGAEAARATGVEAGLDARITTAEGTLTSQATTVANNVSEIAAVSAAVQAIPAPSDRLEPITATNQAILTASGNDGKGYPVAVSGTLSGTNAPAVAVVSGGWLVSNGTAWVYQPPANIPADQSVSRAKGNAGVRLALDRADFLAADVLLAPRHYGQNPPLSGSTQFSKANAWLPPDDAGYGAVEDFSIFVKSKDATATFDLLVMTPTGGAEEFTVRTRGTLTVTATDLQTFSAATLTAAFGAPLVLAEGEKLAVWLPASNSITIGRVTGVDTAHSARTLNSDPSGTQTWSVSSGNQLQIGWTIAGRKTAVPESSLATEVQAKIAGIATNAADIAALKNNPETFGAASLSAGNATFAGANLYLPTTTTPAGTITTARGWINNVSGTKTGYIVVAEPAGGADFTIVSATAVTATGTGLNEWSGLSIAVPEGGLVGWWTASSNSAQIARQTGSGVTRWSISSASVPTGTGTYSFSATPDTVMLQWDVADQTFGVEREQLAADVQEELDGIAENASAIAENAKFVKTQTRLFRVGFDASAPAGVAATGGTWNNTGAGLQTPVGAGDFSQHFYWPGIAFLADYRTTRFRFAIDASGARFAVGYRASGTASGGTIAQVDDANHLLKLHAEGTTFATEPAVISSVALSALAADREYALDLTRARTTITATVRDMQSGETIATVSGFAARMSADTNSVGHCAGTPVIINRTGQTHFRSVEIWTPFRSDTTYILGDSITYGWDQTPGNSWAEKIRAANGGNVVIAGNPGATDALFATAQAGEIAALKPKRVICYLGTNTTDAVSGVTPSTSFTTGVDNLISFCAANGIQLAYGVFPTTSGRDNAANRDYIRGLRSIPIGRMDYALSVDNDGSTIDYEDFYFNSAPGAHPDDRGAEAMFERWQADLPDGFSSL